VPDGKMLPCILPVGPGVRATPYTNILFVQDFYEILRSARLENTSMHSSRRARGAAGGLSEHPVCGALRAQSTNFAACGNELKGGPP
ncbi:MAG: hypothetical protein KDK23_17605, partial [Leptospiraceae bacterium]|nr:hypothetical protein [Leptospiraceae bacterium]